MELLYHYEDLLRDGFQSALNGKLPMLERLQLNNRQHGGHHTHFSSSLQRSPNEIIVPIRVFENAPKLREASVKNLPPSVVILPWTQLTGLVVEDFSLVDCLQVFRMTAALVDCAFGPIVEANPDFYNSQPVESVTLLPPHLLLKSLTFYGNHSRQSILLEILTTPALTKLHLPLSDPEVFVEFLSRSSPVMLREVSVHGYYTLTKGLPLMSALSELEIDCVSVGKLTRILRSLRDSPEFMPNLQTVRISIVTPDRLVDETCRWHHPGMGGFRN